VLPYATPARSLVWDVLGRRWDVLGVGVFLRRDARDGAQAVPAGDTDKMDDRALSLGDDSAGGYAVPKQLDGIKGRKPRPRK
jgi:hypothetical protein